jgi:hypothetical protein
MLESISYSEMMRKLADMKPHKVKYLKSGGDFTTMDCRLTQNPRSIHTEDINVELMINDHPSGETRTINPDCIVRIDNQKMRLSK